MISCFRFGVLVLLLVVAESGFPNVDSNSEDLPTAMAAEAEAQSEVEEMEDQAVKTAVRVKQLRQLLKEVRQVTSVVSGKDDDLALESPKVDDYELKNVTAGAVRGVVTSFWKDAIKLEHRIRGNDALEPEDIGVPHPKLHEVQEQLSEASEEAQQAKSDLKSARSSVVKSARAVVAAEEEQHGKVEAALEGEVEPLHDQLQSSYIVLGRAAVEAEEAAQDSQAAEQNNARIAQDVNAAEAALQVSRQDLAPLSGQLQSLATVELAIRQNMDPHGDRPDMSKVLDAANFGDGNDDQKADIAFKTSKSSLAKMERTWQSINAQRTKLHHSLQERVSRLEADAEEFQATLSGALSADLALLKGLHGLGDEEIACNGAREDLSRIQGYLKRLQGKEKNMKATLNHLGTAVKSAPLVKFMHVVGTADKNVIRLVKKASKEPGNNVVDSAFQDSALDALENLEAKARSLEQKIAKLESQSIAKAPLGFKLREDKIAETALATAVLHARSAAEKSCQMKVHVSDLRAAARKSRSEARVFGSRVAATERTIYGIQHDLATLGQTRRKFRKEVYSLRNRTIALAEDAGRLAEASHLNKLLSTKQPWEVEQSIANERMELEGKLTRKQVAVHERERVLSGLQSQMRNSQIKLAKSLKGVSAGRKAMQKARREVQDLEKQLNQLRKKLQNQVPSSRRGKEMRKSAADGKLRGKHH